MTLDGLEKMLENDFPKLSNRNTFSSYDMRMILSSQVILKEFLKWEIKPLIEEFLAERGLTLSPEKTKITHIETGFDFLGQNVRKYRGKFLIKPSSKNIKNFWKKLENNQKKWIVKQENLIGQLNPIIKGWADIVNMLFPLSLCYCRS